jgi:hypothetical protein
MPRGRRKVVEFTEPQIAVPLSEGEQHVKGKELADICAEIDKLRADAAEHAGAERKKIRALDKRRRQLGECVRTGTEMRPAQQEFPSVANRAEGNGEAKAAPSFPRTANPKSTSAA